MKFNCGLTLKRLDAVVKENRRKKEWHKVFAWVPVRVNSRDCRWLEWVERRYPFADSDEENISICLFYDCDILGPAEYRAIKD